MEYPAGSVSINVIHHWDFWTFINIYYDIEQGLANFDKWVTFLNDWKKDYLQSNERSLYLNCTIVGFMH